ncbi:uncharacterized protein LY89DRAFT_770742 [Mollisia scopiformis]|uniref:Uncharacterized protein n=1 Tax=Mollisia scopiformis TaxID=149040 RepID=A0A194XMA8_MOLSC|nr:uncharacterized protein LY89DRAFT_770742 [Mollisia scopiformis]KUJ21385.1 hypothetical protein LY89DRAFT_770742 [Mollisia scopiformis]
MTRRVESCDKIECEVHSLKNDLRHEPTSDITNDKEGGQRTTWMSISRQDRNNKEFKKWECALPGLCNYSARSKPADKHQIRIIIIKMHLGLAPSFELREQAYVSNLPQRLVDFTFAQCQFVAPYDPDPLAMVDHLDSCVWTILFPSVPGLDDLRYPCRKNPSVQKTLHQLSQNLRTNVHSPTGTFLLEKIEFEDELRAVSIAYILTRGERQAQAEDLERPKGQQKVPEEGRVGALWAGDSRDNECLLMESSEIRAPIPGLAPTNLAQKPLLTTPDSSQHLSNESSQGLDKH